MPKKLLGIFHIDMQRLAGTWVALLMMFVLLRITAWHTQHINGLVDHPLIILYAFASDALGAGILALLLHRLLNHRILRIVLCLLLGYIFSANLENIAQNSSNLDIAFTDALTSDAFILGNALAPAVLGKGLLIAAGLWMLITWITPRMVILRRYVLGMGVGIGLFCYSVPLSPYMDWVFINPVIANVSTAAHMLVPHHHTEQPLPDAFKPLFTRDLSGTPIVTPVASPNILMISLEDTSMQTMEDGWMPHLQAFAQKHITYPHIVTLNSMTTNGMYAMLCGDYPYLNNPDESLWWRPYATHKTCLPNLLKQQGYHTVFMTACDMHWYNMNKLVEPMGFDIKLDRGNLGGKDVYAGHWGVNDASFAHSILAQIHQQSKNQPWFITAMTIGTHPDYDAIQPEYAKDFDEPAHAAFHYMDESISRLLESLDKEGVLKNTLVIITSDESREKNNESKFGDFSGNRGLLIIAEPTNKQMRVDAPFMHLDLPLSILDYLGIDNPSSIGQSVFRNYDKGRDMVFGNVYHNRIFWYHAESQQVTVCSSKSWDCQSLTPDHKPHHLFDTNYQASKETPENSTFLRAFLEYNDDQRVDRQVLKDLHVVQP